VERKMMLYGALCSTWPVNTGVLVEDGVAYAAGGVADFNCTHVVALDAVTGQVKWRNDDSGRLKGIVGNGVSAQGALTTASGQLVMAGGNQVSPALYDLGTGALLSSTDIPEKPHANRGQEVAVFREKYLIFGGKLLYSPKERVTGTAYYTIRSGETEYRFTSGRTAPAWNDTDFVFANGRAGITCCSADSIEDLFKTGLPRLATGSSDRDYLVGALPDGDRRWNIPQESPRETLALVLTENAAIAVDEIPKLRGPTSFVLSAYDLGTGTPLWQEDLPGPALRDGLLVDRAGRVLVALRSGEIVCYGPR
jgi:outer membrane protein assembly factor BamB